MKIFVNRQKSYDQDLIEKMLRYETPLPTGITIGDAITTYWSMRPVASEFLFCTANGRAVHPVAVSDRVASIAKRINVPMTVHSLRHTCATVVTASAGIETASMLLDHADLAMTRRYVAKEKTTVSADKIHDAFVNPNPKVTPQPADVYRLDSAA